MAASPIPVHHKYQSTCCYCGVGCGLVIRKEGDDRIKVEGDPDHPVNRGMLCSKGKNLHYTANDKSDRLLYPEMRYHRNHPRQRVSWEAALTRVAAVFKSLAGKYGPDAVAFYASGQCLTEEYYVINKLIKGFIGSNNIDTNSRLCMSSAVVGYKMSLGEDCVPVSYDDLEACDVLLVAGANPAWCHPIIWRRVELAKEKNPALTIIVTDPRRTQTCDLADLHLQLRPGTDITLHHAIGRALIELGYIDLPFIQKHTNGFETYRESVFKRTLEEAARICGVSLEDILRAAGHIGKARAFLSMWTMGLNQSVSGVNKNLSLINLHLITGQIGKPGAGPFSLTGQPNAMGGREVGGLCNLLPAHRDLLREDHRNEVERFWKISPGTISPKPGLTATEMFDALDSGELKAIWILCTNPLVSLPDARKAEAALKKARFVVVQEISNKAETLEYADLVLPAAAWTEKEGTMTNAGRQVSLLEKVLDPPGEALPDVEIICRLAQIMGFHGFDFNSTSQIFEEHAALTAGTHIDISGLDYTILKNRRTVQWPFPKEKLQANPGFQGTERLFQDQVFYTPDGKARIHCFDDTNHSEPLSNEFPLVMTTGRIRDQWHTRSKTSKVSKLNQHYRESFVEIHPLDAASRGIEEGKLVEVVNSRGQARVKAKLSQDLRPGMVFMPMHWGKTANHDLQRVNNLTSKLCDPVSKEPDFKYTAVNVRAWKKPVQKIILIGAGAAAFGFLKAYRALNHQDRIEIFGNEDLPFYDRVLLPDYITGTLPWTSLLKMDEGEDNFSQTILHRGLAITTIDRLNKTVTDARGHKHDYELLVLATGSRAATLRNVPPMEGIFTMRCRRDADAFKSFIDPAQNTIAIVGGGLLGIELAASLRAKGASLVIIQRISRLMDRQLDTLGSQLLHESLTERGIEIYYNDEIERYLGEKKVSGIRLKSGLTLECQSVVLAIGTIPNDELARSCGLECQRGILVDEYLQTSDENIYAIGEVAEFRGMLYGTTTAAEHQAQILAGFFSGDTGSIYGGSLLMNILKIQGLDVCSLGEVQIPSNSAGYEEIVFIDQAQRYYKKCIVHEDRLVGAILIGDKSEFLEFRDLIAGRMELSEKRMDLLRSGKKQEPVSGRLICSCNQVGEGNLKDKMESGCKDLVQLCRLTGAGTGCGSCRPEVKNIFKNHLDINQPQLNPIAL